MSVNYVGSDFKVVVLKAASTSSSCHPLFGCSLPLLNISLLGAIWVTYTSPPFLPPPPSVCPSVCHSVSLSVCCMSVHSSVCLSACLPTCLYMYGVHLHVCTSIHHSILHNAITACDECTYIHVRIDQS